MKSRKSFSMCVDDVDGVFSSFHFTQSSMNRILVSSESSSCVCPQLHIEGKIDDVSSRGNVRNSISELTLPELSAHKTIRKLFSVFVNFCAFFLPQLLFSSFESRRSSVFPALLLFSFW